MSTDAQRQSFGESQYQRTVSKDEVREAFNFCTLAGWTVDDVARHLWTAPTSPTYNFVAAVRNAVKDLRIDGVLREIGKRENHNATAKQAVWVLGDDRDVVYAHRVIKLYKLAAELGYTVSR